MQELDDFPLQDSWSPEICENVQGDTGVAIDKCELWFWYLARIRVLGDFTPDQAQLTALLGWTDHCIQEAVTTARISVNRSHLPKDTKQSYLNYLAGEVLACIALDLEIPEASEFSQFSIVPKKNS